MPHCNSNTYSLLEQQPHQGLNRPMARYPASKCTGAGSAMLLAAAVAAAAEVDTTASRPLQAMAVKAPV